MQNRELTPFITVIIPVYNIERYLKKCIDSVINQTLANIELVLVDDGSTDSSGSICDIYQEKYSWVSVIHQVNAGVSVARNVGLEFAQGEYVFFLDSDDWLDYDLLGKLFFLAKNKKADLLVSGYFVEWLDSGRRDSKGVDKSSLYSRDNASLGTAFMTIEQNALSCGAIAKLYRRNLLNQYKITFPIGKCWCEDVLFNLSYYERVTTVFVSDIKGYHVRRESGLVSLTGRFVPDMFKIETEVFARRLEVYDLLGIDDEVFKVFVRKRYSSALMWCLGNLYKKDSVLKHKERLVNIKYIFEELNMRKLNLYIPKCRFNNFSIKLFHFLNIRTFDFALYLLFKMKNV